MNGGQREISTSIREELRKYPVKFTFNHLRRHPCVELESDDGNKGRLTFSGSSDPRNWLNLRSQLQRELARMNVQPYTNERRATRVGSFGEKLVEAATKPTFKKIGICDQIRGQHAETVIIDDPYSNVLCPDAIRESCAHARNERDPEDTEAEERPVLDKSEETQIKDDGSKQRRVQFTQAETIQITRLLMANASVSDERVVTYVEGWGDERIHEIIASAEGRGHLTVEKIAEFRREYFGHLVTEQKRVVEPMSIETLAKRFDALERRIAAIEKLT